MTIASVVFLACGVLAATPQGDSQYTAVVHALPCRVDYAVAPRPMISNTIVSADKRRLISPILERFGSGSWQITLRLSGRHQYLWLTTAHCEAHAPLMSLSGYTRNFAVVLQEGRSTSIDEGDRVIAGHLPFAGVESVDVVSLGPEGEKEIRHGIIDGAEYYIENVPPGDFSLRVRLLGTTSAAYYPIVTYRTSGSNASFQLVKDFSVADLARAFSLGRQPGIRP